MLNRPRVGDELARLLDQRNDFSEQYWPHLAYYFKVSEEIRKKCEQKTEESRSENLFDCIISSKPKLSVQQLKVSLESIRRKDLIEKLEEWGVPGKSLNS